MGRRGDRREIITQVTLREQTSHGPYVDAAPDIVVGYAPGYRASWDTTTGKVPLTLARAEHRRVERRSLHRFARGARACCSAIAPCGSAVGSLSDLTVSVLGYFGVAPSAWHERPSVLLKARTGRQWQRCSARKSHLEKELLSG